MDAKLAGFKGVHISHDIHALTEVDNLSCTKVECLSYMGAVYKCAV